MAKTLCFTVFAAFLEMSRKSPKTDALSSCATGAEVFLDDRR
jgi:hypothetical protein